MGKTVRIGLLGCGVVGGGVVEAIHQNGDYIESQCGARLEIVRVAVRDLNRPRSEHVKREWLCTDWREITESDDVDLVIEAIGGVYPGRDAILSALCTGKDVVTANKELLALHGEALYQCAAERRRSLFFEASVLGGIPVLHALQTYFHANQLRAVQGIVNGTSNYILTQMEEMQVPFALALEEAQNAGYAEPDPVNDVEGYDAVYKLQILARFALGAQLSMNDIPREGIAQIHPKDLCVARHLHCRVKHVVEARILRDGTVSAAASLVFVPENHPLYAIQGVQNALCVDGGIVGQVVFAGPGAGAFPTASAILEDVLKVIRSNHGTLPTANPHPVTKLDGEWYVILFNQSERQPVLVEAVVNRLEADQAAYIPLPEEGLYALIVHGDGLSSDCCEKSMLMSGGEEVRVYRLISPPYSGISMKPIESSEKPIQSPERQKRKALGHSLVNQ